MAANSLCGQRGPPRAVRPGSRLPGPGGSGQFVTHIPSLGPLLTDTGPALAYCGRPAGRACYPCYEHLRPDPTPPRGLFEDFLAQAVRPFQRRSSAVRAAHATVAAQRPRRGVTTRPPGCLCGRTQQMMRVKTPRIAIARGPRGSRRLWPLAAGPPRAGQTPTGADLSRTAGRWLRECRTASSGALPTGVSGRLAMAGVSAATAPVGLG
jgi:hypothetical protein